MSEKNLSARLRTSDFGSAGSRRLLRNGEIPGVIYGKGDNVHVIVNAREFNAKKSGFSESTLITLSIEGEGEHRVFVKSFQEDLLRNCIHHIDFFEVTAGHTVRTHVRIELEGMPQGCRDGGVLDQVIHEVEIECLPKDLPEVIKADMVLLAMGFLKPQLPSFAPNVFIAGDAALGASLVVRAMASGREAAERVRKFLEE